MNVICVIDIKNRQNNYMDCLEFIEAVETRTYSNRKKRITETAQKLGVQLVITQDNIATKYLEEPIEILGKNKERELQFQTKKKLKIGDESLFSESNSIRYHIRVHFLENDFLSRDGEIINLHYLATLLRYLDKRVFYNKDFCQRVSVFIVPITGAMFPFQRDEGEVDYDTYAIVSGYLRLLSKQYTGVVYGVKNNRGNPAVSSLDFYKSTKYSFFPLLLINRERYTQLFADSIDDLIEELFCLKGNKRFRKANDSNPNVALLDYIAETDIQRVSGMLRLSGDVDRNEVYKFVKTKENICLMQFSLFCFMFFPRNYKVLDMKQTWEESWTLATELTHALRQLVQNSLQHTQSQECFFTFYLHTREKNEERNTFYNRMAKRFPNVVFPEYGRDEALEIVLSDINDNEDIIDNFVSNLQFELEAQRKMLNDSLAFSGHEALINDKMCLGIRNFFGEFEPGDPVNSWIQLRREDLAAHVGLGQFAQIAECCSAAVKVISCNQRRLTDDRHVFYKAYTKDAVNLSHTQKREIMEAIIPGTQFSILVPIGAIENEAAKGLGQLRQEMQVAEDYKSFAKYLEYREQRVNIDVKEKTKVEEEDENSVLDARQKFYLVLMWEKYWQNKFKELIENSKQKKEFRDLVINFDFSAAIKIKYFTDYDRIEVCLKGIIGALDIFHGEQKKYYIAMTNLPCGFIECIRRIATLLSVKRFPLNLQLFFQESNQRGEAIKRSIFLGNDYSQAIINSYILALEHGVSGFKRSDCKYVTRLKSFLLPRQECICENQEVIEVIPFDSILSVSDTDAKSIFERQLEAMAEGALDQEPVGYKLENTHMRLGSSIHIESFYEMSFLFYRTTIANRLAYILLRHILYNFEKEIDLVNDAIMFYGYASYSKAILTSITEILREYRLNKVNNSEGAKRVAFASFQHNLMLESEETQMYFGLQDNTPLGFVDANNKFNICENVKIVQVVPISSTLTTFARMWKKLVESVDTENTYQIILAKNYTVFWIADQKTDFVSGKPSFIGAKYLDGIAGQTITTKLTELQKAGNPKVLFFTRFSVNWHDSISCSLCYPEKVIEEVPLVETDPTSTVPTQQVRYKMNASPEFENVSREFCERFKMLRDCIVYDHICRRQNHYQFYFDTQKYFYKVKSLVKEWLNDLSKELNTINEAPVLHVIFSPEHNTNVGFAQYVNTHYFKGLAEVVSINVDKQFRSNFVCEHAALRQLISELLQERGKRGAESVRFYFVDDTIISGETFQKANNFLKSLVPKGWYETNLFSKVFLLIDRLSWNTKQIYVNNVENDFISFLHIDVSNTRTHGDSCIGCKLEQDAKKMLKRSATRVMANYWSKKVVDYQKKEYDNREKMAGIDKKKSYYMLTYAHVIQNVIINQKRYCNPGDVFDVITTVSRWLLSDKSSGEGTVYGFEELLMDLKGVQGIKTLLKTVCRPYFSYDFTVKSEVLTFFILLAEFLLDVEEENIVPETLSNKRISYLLANGKLRVNRVKALAEILKKKLNTKKENVVLFLGGYVLTGLAEMGSTYIMRKQTIEKVYKKIYVDKEVFLPNEQKNFWEAYLVNVYMLISNNSDATKEVWLEYLCLTGDEYGAFKKRCEHNPIKEFVPNLLYDAVSIGNCTEETNKLFYLFCHNLLLQNTGISFDYLEEVQGTSSNTIVCTKDYRKQMYCLTQFKNPFDIRTECDSYCFEAEKELFDFLSRKQTEKLNAVSEWYDELLLNIAEVIKQKYQVKEINLALLTETMSQVPKKTQAIEIIANKLGYCKRGVSETKYYIKNRVMEAISDKQNMFSLESDGYYIGMDQDGCRPYIIAYFDTPNVRNQEASIVLEYGMKSVFLYIDIETFSSNAKIRLSLILREILTYRNRILRWLQKDFAGDLYVRYTRKKGEQNILSHEKANSHNTTADDLITLEIFQDEKWFKRNYETLRKEKAKDWLLLRNYTNGQIAKMFNRSFQDPEDSHEMNKRNPHSPSLYVCAAKNISSDNPFNCALIKFSDLDLTKENTPSGDRRKELLYEIVDLKYDRSLECAEFVYGKQMQYYNLEYFRCILVDMIFSAIKYTSDRPDFLLRVDRFLEVKKQCEEFKNNVNNEEMAALYEKLKSEACSIEIFRESSKYDNVDYLVVRNPINARVHNMKNWQKKNLVIQHRLEDALDFADGHMSLLTIKTYIENLDAEERRECEFRYVCEEKKDGEKKYYFENRLPILWREKQ